MELTTPEAHAGHAPPMRRQARLVPGEIVVAAVKQDIGRDDADDGKHRPVMLVSPHKGSSWSIMGFTTLAVYANGEPRTPVPNWRKVGLDKVGYLWSGNLAIVRESDITVHCGWADDELIDTVAGLCRLSEFEVQPLRPYNRKRR